MAAFIIADANSAVVSRNKRPTNAGVRMATATATQNTEPEIIEKEIIDEEIIEEEPVEEEEIIENKSSQFDDILGEASASGTDSSKTALAEKIRAQRAALDARDAVDTANAKIQNSMANGQNACDFGLRECMKKKCGNNYSKCAKDTDTLWGDKMDACRRDLSCTGEEYRIFTTEIKADRDMNTKIGSYTSIIDCGNKYNDCVITECGKTFSKCLGKSAGDKAIEKCKKIANECKEQDSGLPSRMIEVFGTLRQDAEKQIKKDEEKLYSLRDSMADTCKKLGAMFDERTLDCVYTVNFFAGDKNTLFASKKAYAGSTFNCDQNWFGIDVTTFKENAYRLTRSQTAASSAMLGSGVGTAVGSITSGALNRALDRQKAEKALKKAKEEGKEQKTEDEESDTSEKNKDVSEGENSHEERENDGSEVEDESKPDACGGTICGEEEKCEEDKCVCDPDKCKDTKECKNDKCVFKNPTMQQASEIIKDFGLTTTKCNGDKIIKDGKCECPDGTIEQADDRCTQDFNPDNMQATLLNNIKKQAKQAETQKKLDEKIEKANCPDNQKPDSFGECVCKNSGKKPLVGGLCL